MADIKINGDIYRGVTKLYAESAVEGEDEVVFGEPDLQEVRVYNPGIYTPDEGYDGFSQVIVTNNDAPEYVPYNNIQFIDYKGDVLYTWTMEELDAATEMPAIPSVNYPNSDEVELVGDGWNWTLEDLKSEHIPMTVGALYMTDDEKTHIHHTVESWQLDFPIRLRMYCNVVGGYIVDWGDGTPPETNTTSGDHDMLHQYSTSGDFIIKLINVAQYGDTIRFYIINQYENLPTSSTQQSIYPLSFNQLFHGKNMQYYEMEMYYQHWISYITFPSNIKVQSTRFYLQPLRAITVPFAITSLSSNGSLSYSSSVSNPSMCKRISLHKGVTSLNIYSVGKLLRLDLNNQLTSISLEYNNTIEQLRLPNIHMSSLQIYNFYNLKKIFNAQNQTFGTFSRCYLLQEIEDFAPTIGDSTRVDSCYSLKPFDCSKLTSDLYSKTELSIGMKNDLNAFYPPCLNNQINLSDYTRAINIQVPNNIQQISNWYPYVRITNFNELNKDGFTMAASDQCLQYLLYDPSVSSYSISFNEESNMPSYIKWSDELISQMPRLSLPVKPAPYWLAAARGNYDLTFSGALQGYLNQRFLSYCYLNQVTLMDCANYYDSIYYSLIKNIIFSGNACRTIYRLDVRADYVEYPPGLNRIISYQSIYRAKKIRFNNVQPPIISSSVWGSLSTNTIISVPIGSLELYKNTPNMPNPNTYKYVEEGTGYLFSVHKFNTNSAYVSSGTSRSCTITCEVGDTIFATASFYTSSAITLNTPSGWTFEKYTKDTYRQQYIYTKTAQSTSETITLQRSGGSSYIGDGFSITMAAVPCDSFEVEDSVLLTSQYIKESQFVSDNTKTYLLAIAGHTYSSAYVFVYLSDSNPTFSSDISFVNGSGAGTSSCYSYCGNNLIIMDSSSGFAAYVYTSTTPSTDYPILATPIKITGAPQITTVTEV